MSIRPSKHTQDPPPLQYGAWYSPAKKKLCPENVALSLYERHGIIGDQHIHIRHVWRCKTNLFLPRRCNRKKDQPNNPLTFGLLYFCINVFKTTRILPFQRNLVTIFTPLSTLQRFHQLILHSPADCRSCP